MALITCNYFSDVLGYMSKMVVVLPQAAKNRIGMDCSAGASNGKFPVLYLLHGLSDDETVWTRRTSIERYATEMNLAVVMPTTHRSWYTNAKCGYNYYTHIAEEVPEIARSFFPLSEKREDNFIAGLSMGGYGAFKIGLRNPEKFAAAASLSGALDVTSLLESLGAGIREEYERVFGPADGVKGSDNDLFAVTRKAAESGLPKPALYQICGTEDFLYNMNTEYREMVVDLGFDYTYDEAPGNHSWGFWDEHIKKVLSWLPLKKN